jgi:hypothetical protein
MSASSVPETNPFPTAIAALFLDKPPVLVKVRFPKMGTSPDWFLCDSEEDLSPILNRLGQGAEVLLSSMWDLRNSAGAIVWKE